MAKATDVFRSTPSATASHWSRPLPELGWSGVLAVLVLLLGMNAFGELRDAWGFGPTFFQVVWGALYLVAGLALFQRFQQRWLVEVVRWLPLMCLVLGLAVASALWSVDPGLTLRRSISLIGSTLLGVYFAYHFSSRLLMSVLFWTFAILIPLSVITAVLVPEFGTSRAHGGYAWKGITSHVNSLGIWAAVSAVFFLVGTLRGRMAPVPGTMFFGASVLALIMTGSVTAGIAAATGLAVVACFAILPARHSVLAACVLLAGFMLAATILMLAVRAQHDIFASGASLSAVEGVVDPLGRDVTLTGRTHLWQDAMKMIAERPWTGFGYGAVWGLGKYSYLPEFESTTAGLGTAHNGYLNLATNIGVPATVVAVAFLVQMVLASARAFQSRRSPFVIFAIAYMFMFLVSNLAETSLFYTMTALWFVFVALAVGILRPTKVHRRLRSRERSATAASKTPRRRKRRTSSTRSGVPAVEEAPTPGITSLRYAGQEKPADADLAAHPSQGRG